MKHSEANFLHEEKMLSTEDGEVLVSKKLSQSFFQSELDF